MSEEHPNYVKQKQEIEARTAYQMAIEQQADRIREGIEDLLAGTGFVLEVDKWGTGEILLQHLTPDDPFHYYDYSEPLESD